MFNGVGASAIPKTYTLACDANGNLTQKQNAVDPAESQNSQW